MSSRSPLFTAASPCVKLSFHLEGSERKVLEGSGSEGFDGGSEIVGGIEFLEGLLERRGSCGGNGGDTIEEGLDIIVSMLFDEVCFLGRFGGEFL